ncbi:MAG: HAD-IIA family hydrolase [Lawsonella sp.]
MTHPYDCYLVDLDGTLYWGNIPIPHAVENINALAGTIIYSTNNASRSPAEVAQKLTQMGFKALPENVLTSAQLGVQLLQEKVPPRAEILVVGAPYLQTLVEQAGYEVVERETKATAAVIQGHSPTTGWKELSSAARAVRQGALYIATNKDLSLPNEDGLNVGNGAMVGAVELSTGTTALSAGKPSPRAFTQAITANKESNPLVIGDRLDTDIEGGVAAGYDTLCVLTGVATVTDICNAPSSQRPSYVLLDLSELPQITQHNAVTKINEISPSDISTALEVASDSSGTVTVHFKKTDLPASTEISLFIAWAWHNEVEVTTLKGRNNIDNKHLQQWRYSAEH